jgi:hypothetical protein
MQVGKLLKKVRTSHMLMLAAVVVIGYAVYNYSSRKSSVMDSMDNDARIPQNIMNAPEAPGQDVHINTAGNPQPSAPMGHNSEFAEVNGVQTSQQLPPSCSRQQVANPSELLPKDENSEWAKLNPMGSGDLENVNLLKSGYHIGINTINSSLRNANLQLRSEPPNPQGEVGPWNNSTITPDINRRPLEIGSGRS